MGHDHPHRRIGPPDPETLKRLRGYEARERGAVLGSARWDAEVERSLEIGMPAADSIEGLTVFVVLAFSTQDTYAPAALDRDGRPALGVAGTEG